MCNLDCLHCYTHRFRNLEELDLTEKLRLAREIGESGVEYVNLTGGEPLIHPHLSFILESLSDYDVDKSIITNGTVVSEDIANLLYKTETYVFVTVEGPKHIHNDIRGKWTYEATTSGVELLKRRLGSISIVTTVNKINYRSLYEVVDYAVKIDADELALIPVMPSGRATQTKIFISANEYLEALKKTLERAHEYGLKVSAWCTPWIPSLGLGIGSSFCRNMSGMDIDPAGNVLLCDILDFKITNIRGRRLIDVYSDFRNSVLVKTVRNPPQLPLACKMCNISLGCRGGCFARSYILKGGLNAGDPLCPKLSSAP